MAVLGALSLTLEVPDLEQGVRFYRDAGLVATLDGETAQLRCSGTGARLDCAARKLSSQTTSSHIAAR